MTEWISAAEAARRLRIKQASLYSYVSRGVLSSRKSGVGRASLFSGSEVDELARRGRPRSAPRAGDLVIETGLTEITNDHLRYRGLDAIDLATRLTLEDVAGLLWTGSLGTPGAEPGWRVTAEAYAVGSAAQAALPPGTFPLERLQVIVPALAVADPLRLHLDRPAVIAAGRSLIAGMVDCLPDAGRAETRRAGVGGAGAGAGVGGAEAGRAGADRAEAGGAEAYGAEVGGVEAGGVEAGGAGAYGVEVGGAGAGRAARSGEPPAGGTIADRLVRKLCPDGATPALVDVLRAALVLLADHELAASTFAARVAASMRADPYAVVATGLGAVGGSLHGGASLGAEVMLRSADRSADAARVVGDLLRRGERLPGFGHFVYQASDPRAVLILDLLGRAAEGSAYLAVAQAVVHEARKRALPAPNIDFALAVLGCVAGMIPGAGEAMFAVGRAVGWIAHALEEYDRGAPIRPRGIYTGPTAAEGGSLA